ncbi:MAG: DUF3822 family protein [Muribaculaceae bacterium]
MSNTTPASTGDIDIQHPELWTMHLWLDAESISYAIFTRAQNDSLVWGTIALDMSFGNYLKSLENCIYDNPLLLKPYGSVKVVCESNRFVLMPETVAADADLANDVFAHSFPDAEGDVAMCPLPRCGAAMAFELPKGVKGFLQRTFFNSPLCHSLMPMCEYYASKQEQTSLSRMFLHITDGTMRMCVFGKGKLLMANVFHYRSISDATFYVLNAWQSYGLDAQADEVQLAGDKQCRDQLTPMLRKYINYVLPTIFPASALRIGHDAVKAPYQLILLALCE